MCGWWSHDEVDRVLRLNGWVSIGCGVGFLGRGCWDIVLICVYGLLGVGGCVLSGKELV